MSIGPPIHLNNGLGKIAEAVNAMDVHCLIDGDGDHLVFTWPDRVVTLRATELCEKMQAEFGRDGLFSFEDEAIQIFMIATIRKRMGQ